MGRCFDGDKIKLVAKRYQNAGYARTRASLVKVNASVRAFAKSFHKFLQRMSIFFP